MDLSQQKSGLEAGKMVHSPPQSSHTHYKASFFGAFRVTRNEQPLEDFTWRRNKARMLLKWFLLNPGDLFSLDQLGKLCWPDISRKVAASNLHVTLHYLRHILEPELPPGHPSTFIRRNRHNYYWFDIGDAWWTDLLEVRSLTNAVKEAEQRGETARAIAFYNQLVSYYRQAFLPEDIYEDVFSPYRRQHEYAYTQALKRLTHLHIQATHFDDALFCALDLLSSDPYCEDVVKMVVQIHLCLGNTTGAIHQLNDFQKLLKKDMGIELGNDLLALRRSILKADE